MHHFLMCCFTATVVQNFWSWPTVFPEWLWSNKSESGVFGTYINDNFPLHPAHIKYFFCLVFTIYGVWVLVLFSICKSFKLHSYGLNTADYFKVIQTEIANKMLSSNHNIQQLLTYAKPEAASAVVLLMMGGVWPETCWSSFNME
jgi:hypothetical protein